MRIGAGNQNKRNAATVVEFAFVAMPLFALIFGLMELSRALMVDEVLNHSARVGARAGALGTNDLTTVVTSVNNAAMGGGIKSTDLTTVVTVTPLTGGAPTTYTLTSNSNGTLNSIPPASGWTTPPVGAAVSVKVSASYGNVAWIRCLWPMNGNPTMSGGAVVTHE